MNSRGPWLSAVTLFLFIQSSQASENPSNLTEAPKPHSSAYELTWRPDRPRNILFPPFLSFLLPGWDQWLEDQTSAGLAYSGAAVGGLALALSAPAPKLTSNSDLLSSRDDSLRTYILGLQIYQGAGSLSAFHSFRSAVTSRREEFAFLAQEETPGELLAAPFRTRYLERWTTLAPLGLALGFSIYEARTQYTNRIRGLTLSDGFFSGGFSYVAGVNEEALFRGWLMPVGRQTLDSDFWANVSQGLLFGLAHVATNPLPITQSLMGMYLGFVSQQNQWTLGESIFIHTWWDVIAFLGEYSITGKTSGLYLPLTWTY